MRRRYAIGVILIVVGLWIWLSYWGVPYISFKKNWPLLLVGWGIYIVVRRITSYRPRTNRRRVISDLEQGKISVEEAIERLGDKR
jgi:hypothetical protein|uniref:LiaI-LiaF-like transmembrane region domain-containing protein n=1 Tax=candidate division WOR-3 bacterium TaxID=2052148 RepID=A0A7C6AAI4_UNCW3